MEKRIELINHISDSGQIHDVYLYMMEHDPDFRNFVTKNLSCMTKSDAKTPCKVQKPFAEE